MKNLTFARGLSAFFAIALAINVVGGSAGAAFESLDSITADDLNAIVNDTAAAQSTAAAAQDTANTAVSDAAAAQSTADAALPAASLATSETDPTVPASIKDGIDWSELTGIPADFADGVDNNDAKLTEAEVDAYTANNGYLTTETDPSVNAAAKADLSTCAAGDVLLFGSSGWECSTNVSGTGKWSDVSDSGDIYYKGGNVGIGTSSPNAKLYVLGNNDDAGVATTKAELRERSVFTIAPDASFGTTNMNFGLVGRGDTVGIQTTNSGAAADWNIALNPFGGNVGIGTTTPTDRLHVESSQRANSINRSCPAGTLWAGHIAGKASVDWNNDGYTDGNDYNILLGIDTNDYLEDNECVVFGTSTIGTDIDSGEFWVDTNLNRIVDEGEVITGANLGNLDVSGSKVSCEAGHLWLDQNTNGTAPETGECIAPQYDDDSVILRTDFTGETCPVGTQKRDENQDGNTDDGECHIPAVLAKADGNLGIGTTDPQQALHVNGGLMASSLLLEDHNNPTFQAKDFFAHSHSIATNGAHDFESFSIDGETYLAVANHYNNSTYNLDSHIYQWNSTTNQFDEVQDIETNGALDFESFTIDGQTYLAVANHRNDSTYNIDSHIYQWNEATNQFDQIQAIATNGAYDFESFTIDGQTYLAVANYYNDSTRNLDSHIYQWNSTTNQFDEVQDIETNGAYDFASFTIDGQTYLAVANNYNDSTRNIKSHIYQWSSTTNQFDEVQAIETNGAVDFASFTIDGQTYLAVANHHNNSTYNIDSHIYQWSSTTNQFDQIQAIATNGALGFESFTIDGQTYLAVANYHNDSTRNIKSHIYQWNSTTNQFDQIQAIATNGALDFASFTIDGQTYLAVANHYNDSTRNIKSHIYTYDSFLIFSNTSTLAEDNPLFVFQNGTEELVTIENGGNVGIGTDEPGVELHIKDSVPRLRLEAEGTGAAANAYIEFNETDARKAWIGFGSTSNNDLTIYQENTDSDVVIPRGNVGIGTSSPDGALHVRDNSRDYYVNKNIEGETENKAGANYILLHRSYCGNENCGTNYDGQTSSGINSINDNYVFGEISAIRGSWAAWNRKINAKVNTASAYNANRGNVISHMEGVSLVHVMYEGTQYIALKINSGSGMWGITFTGWAYASEGELLKLVYDDDITEESPFESLEDIKIQGGVGINDDSYILGDVGIGTTSPAAKLDVRSGSISAGIQHDDSNRYGLLGYRNMDNSDSSALGGYAMESDSGIESPILFGYDAGANYDNKIRFSAMTTSDRSLATGLQDRMVIDMTSGNVGIGTNSPDTRLQVHSSSIKYSDINARAGSEDAWNQHGFKLTSDNNSINFITSNKHNDRQAMIQAGHSSKDYADYLGTLAINPFGGNVGIGTTAPCDAGAGDGTTISGCIMEANGEIKATNIALSSDSRLKTSVTTIPSALEKILSLRGVTFEWKTEEFPERNFADGTQIGLIAQEVEEVFPELVSQGEYKAVSYASLVSPLIEAVKELHALYQGHADRIAALEEQIQQLQERYEDIEARLTALEAAQ